MTIRETEWDEESQGWMLALAMWRATRCPHCNRDIAECTAEDADGAYEAELPTRCHATTALSIAQAGYTDTVQPEALLWRVNRTRR